MEAYTDNKKNIDTCYDVIEELKKCIDSKECSEVISNNEFEIFMDEINTDIDAFDKLTDDKIDDIIYLYKKSIDKINKCLYYLDNQKMTISYVD